MWISAPLQDSDSVQIHVDDKYATWVYHGTNKNKANVFYLTNNLNSIYNSSIYGLSQTIGEFSVNASYDFSDKNYSQFNFGTQYDNLPANITLGENGIKFTDKLNVFCHSRSGSGETRQLKIAYTLDD